jgi:uncharacterized damage-inducible protein DinB
MTAGLPGYFRYSLWANLRLLDTCADLSDTQLDASTTGAAGSLRATLVRLLMFEEDYVEALKGHVPLPFLVETLAFSGFAALRLRTERSGEELIIVAELHGLSQTSFHEGPTRDGWEMATLIQVINHTAPGRSEMDALLRRQEIAPPAVDGWSYGLALRQRDAETRDSLTVSTLPCRRPYPA